MRAQAALAAELSERRLIRLLSWTCGARGDRCNKAVQPDHMADGQGRERCRWYVTGPDVIPPASPGSPADDSRYYCDKASAGDSPEAAL